MRRAGNTKARRRGLAPSLPFRAASPATAGLAPGYGFGLPRRILRAYS